MFDQNDQKKDKLRVSTDKRKARFGSSHRSLSDLMRPQKTQQRRKKR